MKRLIDTERFRRSSERNPMDEKAEKDIKDKQVATLESDKDGCWATTDIEGYKHLENEVVNSGNYDAVGPE